MTWRVVFQLYDRTERIMDVQDVRALRQTLDRARSDPNVIGWRYWRLTDLPPVRPVCPRCTAPYEPGNVKARACRCGTMHIEYECRTCHTTETDPDYDDGCGSIPFDLEAVNDRYRHRRWRRSA